MRSVIVPRALSLAAASTTLKHAVVFLDHSAQSRVSPRYGGERLFARFEDLPPELLSDALRRCQEVMSPHRSFTIACAGELLRDHSDDAVVVPTSQDESDRVILHAIERQAGDYVPNNLIYHRIRTSFAPRRRNMPHTTSSNGVGVGEDESQCHWEWFSDVRHDRSMTMAPTTTTSSSDSGEGNNNNSSQLDDANVVTMPKVPLHLDSQEKRQELEAINQSLIVSFPLPQSLTDLFHFYPFTNKAACVVYATRYFIVLENLKPVVRGHLLVVPRRIINSIHDFTEDEVKAWGNTVRVTVDVLSEMHPRALSDGFSIAIQSGRDAGQTVWHQHTHVIPYDSRLAGEPEEGDEEEQARRQPRTEADMIKSAEVTRTYFYSKPPSGL
ncbi:Hypothetical protein, putative [Bodo saltans]|uniref:HIT domain-containing protein n=1 Tax=Bodo saltans TaxID=75058 RepID=A0A0S4JIU0_BODSA|nr:Hypothetical protein, putative [Bodo saltans]|eukprot:CUG88914.1 Hypothetical protein, putative [Bodo saltans]